MSNRATNAADVKMRLIRIAGWKSGTGSSIQVLMVLADSCSNRVVPSKAISSRSAVCGVSSRTACWRATRLVVWSGLEQKAREALLSDACAHGGEQAEDGVGAEDVQVAIVEVVMGAELISGQAGLRFGAVYAGEVAVVEGQEALDADEAVAEANLQSDKSGEKDNREENVPPGCGLFKRMLGDDPDNDRGEKDCQPYPIAFGTGRALICAQRKLACAVVSLGGSVLRGVRHRRVHSD